MNFNISNIIKKIKILFKNKKHIYTLKFLKIFLFLYLLIFHKNNKEKFQFHIPKTISISFLIALILYINYDKKYLYYNLYAFGKSLNIQIYSFILLAN